MKPRVVKTFNSLVERVYIKPLLVGWLNKKKMKELSDYLDLQFQPLVTYIARA
jgi:hypothetical protein